MSVELMQGIAISFLACASLFQGFQLHRLRRETLQLSVRMPDGTFELFAVDRAGPRLQVVVQDGQTVLSNQPD